MIKHSFFKMRDWITAWQELIGYFYDGRIARMTSGATTRSTWNRQCLLHSIHWLTTADQYGTYAVAGGAAL